MLFANAYRDTLVFDRNAYQNEQMTKILSKDQYTACLAIKNSYYAAIKSKKRWDELSEKGLTANYEQNTVTKQLVTYELKRKIIIDQYGDDNKGAKKKALKNLATDAPALLKDAPMSVIIPATGALSNSQTATALLLKEQLKLTKQQTDELLVIIQTLKDKLEVAKTNKDSSTFNRGAFESTQMSKILSEEQYTKVLAERSKTFAERQAINSWNELKTNGLNTKYTKDSVLQQATTFFIKKHSVMERYQYNVQLRQKMLRITDMAMPDALAALARIKKTKNLQANNAGFAW